MPKSTVARQRKAVQGASLRRCVVYSCGPEKGRNRYNVDKEECVIVTGWKVGCVGEWGIMWDWVGGAGRGAARCTDAMLGMCCIKPG